MEPRRFAEKDEATARALAFLVEQHCLSLATNGPEGLWASTVFYVNRGFELYFLSGCRTRHVRNLDANSRVAGTINDDVEDWLAIRGAQLEGIAERVDDSRRTDVLEMFVRRYAFPDVLWWNDDGTVARCEQRIYRVRPDRFLFVDHRFKSARFEIPADFLRDGSLSPK